VASDPTTITVETHRLSAIITIVETEIAQAAHTTAITPMDPLDQAAHTAAAAPMEKVGHTAPCLTTTHTTTAELNLTTTQSIIIQAAATTLITPAATEAVAPTTVNMVVSDHTTTTMVESAIITHTAVDTKQALVATVHPAIVALAIEVEALAIEVVAPTTVNMVVIQAAATILMAPAAAPMDPLDHTKPCLTTTHTTTAELNPITTPNIPHLIAHTAHLLTAPMAPTISEVR